jgi:phosphatidylinositol alpha 1,6-mannosyltransferase
MASGLPVLAPDAGGPRDLISHAETGYLLPADPDGFADGAVEAVGALAAAGARARMGAAARRAVLRRSWPAVCDELIGHYGAVLGHGAGHGLPDAA